MPSCSLCVQKLEHGLASCNDAYESGVMVRPNITLVLYLLVTFCPLTGFLDETIAVLKKITVSCYRGHQFLAIALD